MFSEWQIADLIALVRGRYPGWEGFGHGRFVADEIEPKRRTVARARELLSREEMRVGFLATDSIRSVLEIGRKV